MKNRFKDIDYGFDLAIGIIGAVGFVLLVGGAALLLFNLIFEMPTDDSDIDKWNRSGMEVHTDNFTGVQYLTVRGALTPRLSPNGDLIVKEVDNEF